MKDYTYHIARNVDGTFVVTIFRQINNGDSLFAVDVYNAETESIAVLMAQGALSLYRAYARQEVAA
jgi:hypothetical protein